MSELLKTFPRGDWESNGRGTAVWIDKNGVMHRAVGADVHPNIRLLWTACEQQDIPANSAWIQRPEDKVTCYECRSRMP